jgi:tetratricopeptide (TPR) repeat protein/nucleotide-binding universal stress UspA family protein
MTWTLCARAQATAESGRNGAPDGPAEAHSRILLVLPFDNRTGQPSLEWIREAAPEILSSRFASAGFAPMSRDDRRYALDHLGLPQGFHPSRASSLKLAETLDADSIIVGSYLTDGTGIVAEAQVVDVPRLRMSEAVSARGEMRNLVAVFDSLAWKLTRQLDPGFSGSEETFVAAGAGLRLDAFEQYIRGITEPDQQERLRHLRLAVQESPEFGPAWMALGREDYNGQRYEEAAEAFAKVGRGDSDALQPEVLEAGFYRGLSLLFSGDYRQAEEAFEGVARVLPLAEVVNNEGVAVSRQGRDGIAFFSQAEAADPNAADYHFNLAVSLKREGKAAEALAELTQCLRLRPNDSEAQELLAAWKNTGGSAGAGASPDANGEPELKADPLERIARDFDAVAFRQAALMLDQMDASRLAALTPLKRAQKLAGQAKDYLDRGLLLEAERLYQSAVAADGRVAEAHAGLAEVRERTGDADGARKEARAALELASSSDAYMVLARLDLKAGRLDEADKEVSQALTLNPASRAAQELKRQIGAREGPGK